MGYLLLMIYKLFYPLIQYNDQTEVNVQLK